MRNSGCCVVPAAEVAAEENTPVEQSIDNTFGSLHLESKDHATKSSETNVPQRNKAASWQLSKLERVPDMSSIVKNTFIKHPVQGEGSFRRTCSVPKDFGSL